MANSSCPERCRLLVTCEHARNTIPASHQHLFSDAAAILETHRAYDPGALAYARFLAGSFTADLLAAAVSRLLVDCNRSEANPRIFSPFSRTLDQDGRELLLARYYRPHLQGVIKKVAAAVSRGFVLVHIGVHTFTPVLNGRERRADIGLLYDPARETENKLCDLWKRELRRTDPALRVRKNYPYQGKTDGLPAILRKKFSAADYLGIELEINQDLCAGIQAASLQRNIAFSLRTALEKFCGDSGARKEQAWKKK